MATFASFTVSEKLPMKKECRTHFVTAQIGITEQRVRTRLAETASATVTTYL